MKKINKILIGTHNEGKYKEISALLPKGLKRISPSKFGIQPPNETGKTFKENSILKAKYFAFKSGLYSISDDSGLEVVALSNRPGIYSARWAKKLGGFKNAMKKIIYLLKNKKKRAANFVCALTLATPNGKATSSIKKLKGNISTTIKGSKGFGYDSIFIPKERKNIWRNHKKKKMKIDHRYLAYKSLKKKLKFFEFFIFYLVNI